MKDRNYLVTVDFPMPNGLDAPLPLRTVVSVWAPYENHARLQVQDISPGARIVDVQEREVAA